MYNFVDKYHFKNYIRKIGLGLGLNKETFDEKYSDIFYTIFEVERKYDGFFRCISFELCKQIAYEMGKLNEDNFRYFILLLSDDYRRLQKELVEISMIIENHKDFRLNMRCSFGIDIKKFPVFYRSACAQNKFLEIYQVNSSLSKEFIDFITQNEMKKGLYFLYDKENTLIYIGKSINLGSRILSSVRERGASFVSIAETKSKSDMHVYEPYYILKEKPKLNNEFKETDGLNIKLEELKISKPLKIYE